MKDDLSPLRNLFHRMRTPRRGRKGPGRAVKKDEGARRHIADLFADLRYSRSEYFRVLKLPLRQLKKDRGAYGEYLLFDALRREKGKWLFNLYLPHNGETTEVDSMLFSPKGIFVFESKNISGRIYGRAQQRDWVHTFLTPRGIKKKRFFNPLMQNGAHEKAVKALAPGVPVYPVVVFGRNSRFYTEEAENCRDRLTTLDRLPKLVRKTPSSALQEETIRNLYDRFAVFARADARTRIEHIAVVHGKNTGRSRG